MAAWWYTVSGGWGDLSHAICGKLSRGILLTGRGPKRIDRESRARSAGHARHDSETIANGGRAGLETRYAVENPGNRCKRG